MSVKDSLSVKEILILDFARNVIFPPRSVVQLRVSRKDRGQRSAKKSLVRYVVKTNGRSAEKSTGTHRKVGPQDLVGVGYTCIHTVSFC